MIHTTRKKLRNASGGSVGERGVLLPLAGGIAGGTATVLAAAKFQWHPVAVAAAAAVGGFALANSTRTPWMKQAALGAAIGAGTLGGVTLAGQLLQPKPVPKPPVRSADGEPGYVTRQELQDALAKTADVQKEQQKQQTSDLLTALRAEIRRTVVEMNERKPTRPPFLHTTVPEPEHDYLRDAYSNERRDADEIDYLRDAYGDEPRDAGDFDARDAASYDDERWRRQR